MLGSIYESVVPELQTSHRFSTSTSLLVSRQETKKRLRTDRHEQYRYR